MRRQVRISKAVCFSWCMIGALICLFLPESLTNRGNITFLNLYKFTPSIGRSIPLAAVSTPSSSDREDELSRRCRELETQKNQIENHCANLSAELAAEHAKVEKLAAMRSRFPALSGAKFISADVIIAGTKANDNGIVINRGQADSIRKGQYVLSNNSVIGIVQETWSRTSRVKLITDRSCSIGVETEGSRAIGLMKGTAKGLACISQNRKRANKGDAVYTYKNPGLLDVPVIVGRVVECRPNDDKPLLWDIMVAPAVKIEDLLDVEVVVMNP